MNSGYAGSSVRIPDEDLSFSFVPFLSTSWMGLLPKYRLALLLVRLLLPIILQTCRGFVGSLFDAMREFVAETGSTVFFMIDGDVSRPWTAALAQLVSRSFLDAIKPDMFGHACKSQLIVHDKVHSRPIINILDGGT